jgi:hypothetical protein
VSARVTSPTSADEAAAAAERMHLSPDSVEIIRRNFGRPYEPPPAADPMGTGRVPRAADAALIETVAQHYGAESLNGQRQQDPAARAARLRRADDEPRFRLLSVKDVLALPDRPELVDGLLPANGSAILYGPAGTGKSFLALDLALTIASSADDWHGHTIRPGATTGGAVLYVAAEGDHGLKRRLLAWLAATEYHGELAIRFIGEAVQLRTLEDPGALLQEVERSFGLTAAAFDLVIFDTLSQCMAGAKENAQEDASAVIASLNYLRAAIGCTTLALHHTGVIETRERGSTVFRGAVDALLSLREVDGVLTLESDKVRDGPPLTPLYFRLAPVADSMVLVGTNSASDAAQDLGRPLSKVTMVVWQSIQAIATAEGVTCSEWKESSPVVGRSFYRARKTLVERGLVLLDKGKYRLARGKAGDK